MITALTTEQINKLKDIVLIHLEGEELSVVKIHLQVAANKSKTKCESLYRSINMENANSDPFILGIFERLNIKNTNRLLKKPKTFYDLLTCLYHDGHEHLEPLLKLIENTQPERNLAPYYILGALGTVALAIFLSFKRNYFDTAINWTIKTFPSAIQWLEKTFSLLKNIPLIGLVYSSLSLSWSWYTTFTNGTTTPAGKLQNLLFKTITKGLTIAAYTLCFLAAGPITATAATLFVVSSGLELLKVAVTWFKSSRALNKLEKNTPTTDQSWGVLAEHERAKNLHKRSLRSVFTAFCAAVLSTGAVAIWCFFPPSIIVTISCIAFLTLVGFAKHALLSNINVRYDDKLQESLSEIDAELSYPLDRCVNQNSFNNKPRKHTHHSEVAVTREKAEPRSAPLTFFSRDRLREDDDNKLNNTLTSLV